MLIWPSFGKQIKNCDPHVPEVQAEFVNIHERAIWQYVVKLAMFKPSVQPLYSEAHIPLFNLGISKIWKNVLWAITYIIK